VTEIERIEGALDTLLVALFQHREQRRRAAPYEPIKALPMMSPAELAALSPVETLLRNPIERALRNGIRELGERLFVLGDIELMQETLARVAERDPARAGRRLSVVDHAWDNVGTSTSRTGWLA
jgi:hypothetical protein